MEAINQIAGSIDIEAVIPFVRVLIIPAIMAIVILDEDRLQKSIAKKSHCRIIVEFLLTMAVFFRIIVWVVTGS